MDAHHAAVMKAREGASDGVRRYFAYSTILDREAFETWRSQHGYDFFELPPGEVAEALDVDLIFDFPSRWWGGRVAGLAPVPGRSVFGVLFDIPERDWPVVGHKEGAVTGMCCETPVKVRVGERTLEATAFTTSPARRSEDGPVSRAFVDALVRGARQAALPQAWLDRLSSLS